MKYICYIDLKQTSCQIDENIQLPLTSNGSSHRGMGL